MVLSGQKRSKVAPRRHVSSIPGLLHHSRRLHQALSALDREESRAQRRLSLTRMITLPQRCSTAHSVNNHASESTRPMATAVVAASKPLVFRKTKREIERERERALQEKLRMQQQLDDMTSSIIASCIHSAASKLQPSCRAEFLRDARQLRIGERGRSRRRLLF
ncbi:hypothetical protein Gpo141_00006173 [Globisporangium polare]